MKETVKNSGSKKIRQVRQFLAGFVKKKTFLYKNLLQNSAKFYKIAFLL